GIAAYAIGSAVLTALGRGKGGDPLSPRYITTSSLLWVANLGILFVLIAQARNSHDNLKRKLIPAVGIAAILGIAGLICYCSFDGQNGFAWYYERLLPAQRELFV